MSDLLDLNELETRIVQLLNVNHDMGYGDDTLLDTVNTLHGEEYTRVQAVKAVARLVRNDWIVKDEENTYYINPDIVNRLPSPATVARLEDRVTTLVTQFDSLREEKERVEKELNELKTKKPAGPQEKVVQVQLLKGKKIVKSIKAVFHHDFAFVLDLARARQNILLYGPTGCGKTFMPKQIAESLDLPFGSMSLTAGTSETAFGGSLLPTGEKGAMEFINTEFLRIYETGGVFVLDEMDAADPNTMLTINTALANGFIHVPRRKEKRYAHQHPDFICIATANTPGTNPDRNYNGRNRLDLATLNRFTFKVEMDYDKSIEEALCPDDELRETMWRWRRAVQDNHLERAVSTRCLMNMYQMKTEFGWDVATLSRFYFAGWRQEEKNKVLHYMG